MRVIGGAWLVLGLLAALGAGGQEIRLEGAPAVAAVRQFVTLESESAEVPAGRPAWVEVRFRVAEGKHINAHVLHDELLVPTVLALSGNGMKVQRESYPEGVPLRLEGGDGEVLSVYQGEFRVRVEVTGEKGSGVLAGMLRYQACDARSCFPPRSLPVRVMVETR